MIYILTRVIHEGRGTRTHGDKGILIKIYEILKNSYKSCLAPDAKIYFNNRCRRHKNFILSVSKAKIFKFLWGQCKKISPKFPKLEVFYFSSPRWERCRERGKEKRGAKRRGTKGPS
jgi:hypothetical protein